MSISKRAAQFRYTKLRLISRLPELRLVEGWYGDIKISCQFNDLLRVFGDYGNIIQGVRDGVIIPARMCGDARVAVVIKLDRAGHLSHSCVIVLVASKTIHVTRAFLRFYSEDDHSPMARSHRVLWQRQVAELLQSLGFTVFPTPESEAALSRFGVPTLKDAVQYPYQRKAVEIKEVDECDLVEDAGLYEYMR